MGCFLSSIVLWGLSYHICVVDCWHVCLYWLYQRLLILKLVPGCDWKLSVGCIQTVNTNLITPQIFGRLWLGCWLGVQPCSLKFIYLLDLKLSSSSSFKPSFVDCWLVCIIYIRSAFIDPEIFPWVLLQTFSGMYSNRTYGFASPTGLWKVMAKVPFFYFTCRNQYIAFFPVSSSSYSILQLCR